MGKEIISDKEYEKHPVVYRTFKIKVKRQVGHIKFDFEIFSQDRDVEEDKWFFGKCY